MCVCVCVFVCVCTCALVTVPVCFCRRISRDDIVNYIKSHYTGSRMVLAAAGGGCELHGCVFYYGI